MPWDYFCPLCGSALAGDMEEDEIKMREQMDRFDAENKGKIILCLSCNRHHLFGEVAERIVTKLLA